MRCILAYDLGTSGVKASLYDERGRLLSAQYGQYPTLYPEGAYREQRPRDWWQSVKRTTNSIMKEYGNEEIVAIGISGHSLGCVAVGTDGEPVAETTPIWSDARAVKQADAFFEKTGYQEWYETTGNGFPRHLYAIFKQIWMKENQPGLYQKTACFLGSKDYINFRLTGKKCTDRSYASGSGAYSLRQGQYVEKYLECAGMEPEKMPPLSDSADVIGEVTKSAAKELGIRAGIPVVAGGVDNACMALGANCWKNKDAYASLGSSAWITACTDAPFVDFGTKIYTFAHCVPGMFIPSVGIFASGSALEWAIRNLFAGTEGAGDVYGWLSGQAKAAPAGANGLIFIPNLAGGSSFDPSPDVRGLLAGMDLKHTKADVVRAVFEGIALHLRCAYDVLLSSGMAVKERLLLVGGGARNDTWREIYASVFGMPVVKTAVVQDAASLGAATLAAVGTGIWKDYGPLDHVHGEADIIVPEERETDVYRKLLPVYRQLVTFTQDIANICQEVGI